VGGGETRRKVGNIKRIKGGGEGKGDGGVRERGRRDKEVIKVGG